MLASGRDIELGHLVLGDPAGGVDHHVTSSSILWESDEIANVGAATAQKCAQTVQTERQTTVRRSPVFERT